MLVSLVWSTLDNLGQHGRRKRRPVSLLDSDMWQIGSVLRACLHYNGFFGLVDIRQHVSACGVDETLRP